MLRKKALLLLLLLTNFLVLPLAIADQVVLDQTLQQEAESLNIDIPADTPPGENIVSVEITEPDGSVHNQDFPFCKAEDGTIYWSGTCPEPAVVIDPAKATSLEQLPVYNPAEEPKQTQGSLVAGLAALGVLGAAGASTSQLTSKSDSSDDQGSLEGVEAGDLDSGLEDMIGAGDLGNTWVQPAVDRIDVAFDATTYSVSHFSPLLARIFADGGYLRAMFGSAPALFYPLALILGTYAANSSHNAPIPPELKIVTVIAIFGIFDALVGLIAALRYALGIVAAGNMNSMSAVLTTLGISMLFFAPGLIASSFRPFRRAISSRQDQWERWTDVFVASIAGGWVTTKIVGGLNGLAHRKLPISDHAQTLGYIVSITILSRILLEGFAMRHFPIRLGRCTPETAKVSFNQKVIALAVRTDIFIFVAAPFIGANKFLWIGAFLFSAPPLFRLYFDHKLPKLQGIHRWSPKGLLNLVAMVYIGTLLGNALSKIWSGGQLVSWSFVILSLPGVILGMLLFFAEEHDHSDWRGGGRGLGLYRFGGLIVLSLFVAIVFGLWP